MLKSLEIFNFQSHKHSTLHFHSGLNIIVGPTDSGKSVILRTLRKLFFNRPFGSAFRSTWGGETYIETLTDDDSLIGLKEDSEKTYFLNDLEFKAFGQSIPKEIADNLNVNEVNIQQQLDSPFLFSQSPGEVAQHFNKIAHLEQITLSISNLKKWVTQLESTIKHKQEDLSKKIEELKTFDYLEKFEIELEVLEDMEKKVSSKKSQKTQLSTIINKFNFVEDEIECYQDILLIEDNLILIIDKIQEVQQKKQKADDFSKLIYNIEGIELDIESEKDLISCEKDVEILIETLNKLSNIESDRDRLNKVVKNVNSVSDDLEYNKKLYNKLHTQFEKEMGDQCPMCLQLIEKWKFIKGYEEIYEISNFGRVRSYYENALNIGKEFKYKTLTTTQYGYKTVSLYNGIKQKTVSVHRLVLETFKESCPNNMEASHIDGDPSNNRLDNLIWETHQDNENRKEFHGTRPLRTNSKLTELEVKEIKDSYNPYKNSYSKLAKKYGVCEDTIKNIINGKLWKNI